MPKLSAKVPQALHDAIEVIQIRRDTTKGKTLAYLVERAIEQPDFPCRDFGNGADRSCSLQATEKLWTSGADYRVQHQLPQKIAFFVNTLIRGASICLDEFENQAPQD